MLSNLGALLEKPPALSRSPVLGGLIIALATIALQSQSATFIVSNLNDSGSGSLRQAISDANSNSGPDTITFQILAVPPFTITPLSALPAIIDPVVIDASTQTGFVGQPIVELNGASAGGGTVGLQLLAGNSTVRGLVINRFYRDAIHIEGPGNNQIKGNFIGCDLSGTAARGNGSAASLPGIYIFRSSGNIVGGTASADRNVISGNSDAGIYLQSATNNTVLGNYIGTTLLGTGDLGNTNNGVALLDSPQNTIGGTASGSLNVICANHGSGVYLKGSASTGNVVQGNYIGVDVTGSQSRPNVGDGVTLQSCAGNTIGGTASGAGNVLSANSESGISFFGSTLNNLVQGNLIGTAANGTTALGNLFAGITIYASSSNVIGGSSVAARNVIAGNKQDGIFITNSLGNSIQGNYIGVDASGANPLPNLFNGISISAAGSNTIGGTVAGARNIISGNAFYGIQMFNAGSSGNLVQGNYIGTDASGQVSVSNVMCGVRIETAANTIGGTSSGARNVISGNQQDGIFLVGLAATGNLVQGNYIGISAAGNSGLKNIRAGIGVSGAPANTIGGTAAGAGNVISANANSAGDAGIYLFSSGATGNVIQGNLIGTDATGSSALGNTHEGIYLDTASTNTIGGTAPGAGNVISANQTRGIFLTNCAGNVIQGNLIGTAANGATALGNTLHSVECEANACNNIIGGLGSAANKIAFTQNSSYSGIRIRVGSTNNLIRGNSIFSNGALGISLNGRFPTANDHCDVDPGANMQQNYPVLAQAVSGSTTGIRGTLDSTPNSSFLLQFFASPTCDSGTTNGEGQIFLGEKTVTTGNDCTGSFVASLPVGLPTGYVVTATATDAANNTSEFSTCVTVGPLPRLTIASGSTHESLVSWTNTATGFVLKLTGNLSPPVQWVTVTNAPTPTTNGQFLVTLPPASTNRFFRLSFE